MSAPAFAPTWVICLCAQWCGTCREYQPLFAQLAAQMSAPMARDRPGVRFAWVDIEDHADLADPFDVETFPTLLIASAAGTHFLGPLLPRIETLTRLLATPQAARAPTQAERELMAALEAQPQVFVVPD
ncbi:MAG: thioredoxin family protein [Burkholderiaceae bacterium]|jgi:thiol-disulfide isomerase/thioredoxin|nr:thioredoxin family protein [Burkholderiaceae bacterium]